MKKITENLLLKEDASLMDAMTKIGLSSMRILFVVDDEKRLLGTITDGDIRRALIDKRELESDTSCFMCDNPISVNEDYTKNAVIKMMTDENILVIPILKNENNTLIGYESIIDLSKKPEHSNYVLIMAGGFGKRLRPLTDDKPKPMLEISGRPILEKTISQLSNSGFKNFFISIHYKAEIIEEYFGDGSKWNVSIQYIREEKPMGTAGSLHLLSERIKTELPLLVLNSDLITTLDYNNLINFQQTNKSMLTICTREQEQIIPFGVLEIDNQKVLGITEKPKKKYFANAGIYLLMPNVFDLLKNMDMSFDMPDLINYLIENGYPVEAFPIHEYWKDIGRMSDYVKVEDDLKNIK